jgi:tetratricopeptide (TPR) repeat protein
MSVQKLGVFEHNFFTLTLEQIIPQGKMEHTPNSKNALIYLISEYEALAQKGDITRLEEKSLLKLVNYFESEYQRDKALEVIEHALDIYPFSVEFYLKKVDLLIHGKQHAKALEDIELAENFAPADFSLQSLKCKVLALNGHHQQALDLLQELRNSSNGLNEVELLYTEAIVQELMKDYTAAQAALKNILLFHDELHSKSLEKIGELVSACRNFDESISLHNGLIDKSPYNHLAWFNLGQAYSSKGEYSYAIDAFEYAFIIDPSFEQAYLESGELCLQIGQHKRALNIYLEAIEIFGVDIDILFNIGQCMYFLGQVKNARKYFNKALKLDPYHDELHYYIALTFAREGRWINAVKAYKRALDLDDMREEYYAGLGEAMFHLNEFERAEYYFKKAIKDGPEQAFVWLAYSNFLMATNRIEKAIAILNKADFYTQSIELEYCKTACYFLSSKTKEGMEALEIVLEKDPEMYTLLYNFAPHLQFDSAVQSMIQYYKNM